MALGFEVLTKCYELNFQDVDSQDKGVVVKLTYDRLIVTRPSGVELLSEGKWLCCTKFTVIDPSVKPLSEFLHVEILTQCYSQLVF